MTLAVLMKLLHRVRQRRAAAKDSFAQGKMTPEFSAALNDPFVYRFRAAELVVVVVLIFLMVTKAV